jgi:hypothetical protein
MTAARGDNARATAFFTGFLALAAGGAGLVVAGLVLGFDYLLHGEPGERQALAASRARDRRDRHADALAWLEADRADRARARAAVRDWFAADRDTRGPRPSSEETVGRFLARLWNHAIVDMTRFRKGWKAGRDEARERRADGEKRWWMPEREPVADAPATTPRQEKANPESQPIRDPGVVDAEVVPDRRRRNTPWSPSAPTPARRRRARDLHRPAGRAARRGGRQSQHPQRGPVAAAVGPALTGRRTQ